VDRWIKSTYMQHKKEGIDDIEKREREKENKMK
jgi:hypothetical protein